MGHDIKHYAEYFERTKNGSEVVCQYGEWLKSSRGRPCSPVRGGSSTNKQSSNEVRTEVQAGNDNLEQSAAEIENTKENPTEDDISAFGRSVDSGKILDCTEKGPVTEGIIMGRRGPRSSVTDAEVLNSRGESVSHDLVIKHVSVLNTASEAGHVGNKDQNGLQGLKQKPTWTRLARMECGPSMDKKEASPHKLGKRGLMEIDVKTETVTEVKGGKRGRYLENVQSTETAGVQEHPC